MEKLDNLIKKMNTALWSFGGIMLLLISLSVSYDVVTRYVFKYSNEWVGEYAGYMLVCITFLAAPYTLYVGGMTKVDLITSMVRPRVKWILAIIVSLLSLLYLGVFFRMSFNLMMRSLMRGWRSQTSIRTLLWIPQLIIPTGAILMILSTLVVLLKTIVTGPEKKAVPHKLTDEELTEKAKEQAKDEGGDIQ